MAGKRSIPTGLFSSPDFFELSSDTIRLIMIGLILDADDEGRGSAHPRLLARKLDKHPEEYQALAIPQAPGILQCYEVAGRAYYVLCHWRKYQTLSKPTPSTYPAPPDAPSAEALQNFAGYTRETQESPGESLPEGEGEKEEEQEVKGKGNEDEGEMISSLEAEPTPPSYSPHASSDASFSTENKSVETDQVAFYLRLPLTTELEAVVREFQDTPALSLIGEAIEARSWVDDPRRNRKGQPMSVAFFRRWLKRSRGDYGTPKQGQEYHDLLKRAIHAPLLLIDDLDKPKPSEFRESIYYLLIDKRTLANSPLALSSNVASLALERWIGGAARSRLLSNLCPVEMQGPDYRLHGLPEGRR